MDKDLLKIKIAKCFIGNVISIDFDPDNHYGWLNIRCGVTIFPDEIEKLRNLLYVSNISASIDYSSDVHLPYLEISCNYEECMIM